MSLINSALKDRLQTRRSLSGQIGSTIVADWVARTVTAGGTVAASTAFAMENFINGCEEDGNWQIMQTGIIFPLASDAYDGCFVPLVDRGQTITLLGSGYSSSNYTLSTGLDQLTTGGRAIAVTGVTPNSLGCTSSSAQCSAYQRIVRGGYAAAVFAANIGATNSNSRICLNAPYLTAYSWDTFTFSGGGNVQSSTTGTGLLTGVRNSTNSRLIRNASVLATQTGTGGTYPGTATNVTFFLFPGEEVFVGNSAYDKSVYGYLYFGGALINETAHYNRVQALQTALGRQV